MPETLTPWEARRRKHAEDAVPFLKYALPEAMQDAVTSFVAGPATELHSVTHQQRMAVLLDLAERASLELGADVSIDWTARHMEAEDDG